MRQLAVCCSIFKLRRQLYNFTRFLSLFFKHISSNYEQSNSSFVDRFDEKLNKQQQHNCQHQPNSHRRSRRPIRNHVTTCRPPGTRRPPCTRRFRTNSPPCSGIAPSPTPRSCRCRMRSNGRGRRLSRRSASRKLSLWFKASVNDCCW